ncbi:outer membrane beta-barrel protein [Candidatus Nitrospira bockiana]
MGNGVYAVRMGLLVVVLVLGAVAAAPAQEPPLRWGFGSDIGFTSGTVNGTVFTLGFQADYYLDRAFSLGPMLLLAPIGDLTQIALAGVARYHVRTGVVNWVPFAGFGLIHADLDKGAGPGRIDKNDTSWYIPLGLSAEFPVNPKLAFSSTLLVNLHDIDLEPAVERDNTSVSLLFGIRFGP